MMKFTKEEISLCKQVAERYRKEIKYGDWFYWEYGGTQPALCNDGGTLHYQRYKNKKKSFPLWTPSDCLEFLGEKFERLRFCDDKKFEVQIWLPDGFYYHIGKTPLEAYLKAVLAVLEED